MPQKFINQWKPDSDCISNLGICRDHLRKNINVANVLDIIILADLHGEQALKDEAMKYFTENVKTCMESAAYKKLAPKHPFLVIEILSCIIKEKVK